MGYQRSANQFFFGPRVRNMVLARVVGGGFVEVHTEPYMLAMYSSTDRDAYHKCSLVRVSRYWALTAAHCVRRGEVVYMTHMDHNLSDVSENCSSTLTGYPRTHPTWDESNITVGDLAVVRITDPPLQRCETTGSFAPLVDMGTPTPQHATVLGWGHGSRGVLSAAVLTTVSKSECSAAWNGIDMSCHVCAGNETADACYGDSGGPLMHSRRLLGITSYGSRDGCASKTHPTVFMDIRCFVDWIEGYTSSDRYQELHCACAENESDGVGVRYSGCGGHGGDSENWCYTAGGLKCLQSHPSAWHGNAGWRNCAGSDGVPAPGPPHAHGASSSEGTASLAFVVLLFLLVCRTTR